MTFFFLVLGESYVLSQLSNRGTHNLSSWPSYGTNQKLEKSISMEFSSFRENGKGEINGKIRHSYENFIMAFSWSVHCTSKIQEQKEKENCVF